MQEFVSRYELDSMQHLADVDGQLSAQHFGIRGHSSWLFIDGETGQTQRHVGELTIEQLEGAVTALAANNA